MGHEMMYLRPFPTMLELRPMTAMNWQDITFTAHDGLRLYGRRYGRPDSGRRPVLCLAGLTRNCRDFHDLAAALSNHPLYPREVFCLDYRGRGRSDYDPNWRNYNPWIEMIDTLDFMAISGLSKVTVLGTSRGGIIAMLMAVTRPAAIGAVVFNDIGPVIETAGLARMMGYAGKVPLPPSWESATELVRAIGRRDFTALSDQTWGELARQWFNDKDGRPAPGYDPNLMKALEEVDITKKMPEMWPQFEALKRWPTLVIRGKNSDLLSAKTVTEMARRHPRLASVEIPDQGHAPLLKDRFSISLIADFLREADREPLAEEEDARRFVPTRSAAPAHTLRFRA
jgi:pimeloyl-ACP methyl ester carboxylesterase